MKEKKKNLLRDEIRHIDITKIDPIGIIDSMRDMSFSSRDTARATDILQMMICDKECTNWLTLAGSSSAGGCMQVYTDMVR
ncbi:MAG TPA: deoxyhypusine synthase family protein, partial [Bacteroidales bacterium]|nr:deoxyhypusine synthase family protein [Bacteroidales bacterium]